MHLHDLQFTAQCMHQRALDEARAARASSVARSDRHEDRRRPRRPSWVHLSGLRSWEPGS
ncbi:MAG: hypothetical protein EA416_04270 [Trueperaceae bacterium]|nr:MAG: hypothetical protein EA416_04270 [Trueperaceae bacterium]